MLFVHYCSFYDLFSLLSLFFLFADDLPIWGKFFVFLSIFVYLFVVFFLLNKHYKHCHKQEEFLFK